MTGDIGCYALGFLKPLERLDTILCMGASVTMAHGMAKAGNPRKVVGIIGDSTFFHSGMTGIINVAYNQSNALIIVVDNRTTAMTGHQDHPGTGRTLMGQPAPQASIEEIARACGFKRVHAVNPIDLQATMDLVSQELAVNEPSLIVARGPCVLHEGPRHRAEHQHRRMRAVRRMPGPRLPRFGIHRRPARRQWPVVRRTSPFVQPGVSPSGPSRLVRRPGMNQQPCVAVVLVGVGGQGILLAAEIIAHAAMFCGHDVKTNEVHGMAQRGGSVMGQIRYGREVHSPLIAEGTATALLSLEKIEAIRCAHFLAADGLAVVSSQQIVPVTVSSGMAKYPDDAEQRLRRIFKRLTLLDAAAMATEIGEPGARQRGAGRGVVGEAGLAAGKLAAGVEGIGEGEIPGEESTSV